MELTNLEKARVFGMYLGCDVETTNGSTIVHSPHSCANSDYKLKLIPLLKIKEEDANELSEVFFPDGNIYDYLHGAPTGKAIVLSITKNRQTNTFYPHARIHDGFEYLKSKGYAVPLFFTPNHPANGKTAIELGLAIDATATTVQGSVATAAK